MVQVNCMLAFCQPRTDNELQPWKVLSILKGQIEPLERNKEISGERECMFLREWKKEKRREGIHVSERMEKGEEERWSWGEAGQELSKSLLAMRSCHSGQYVSFVTSGDLCAEFSLSLSLAQRGSVTFTDQ